MQQPSSPIHADLLRGLRSAVPEIATVTIPTEFRSHAANICAGIMMYSVLPCGPNLEQGYSLLDKDSTHAEHELGFIVNGEVLNATATYAVDDVAVFTRPHTSATDRWDALGLRYSNGPGHYWEVQAILRGVSGRTRAKNVARALVNLDNFLRHTETV